MKFKKAPRNMEVIGNYRNDEVQISTEIESPGPLDGAAGYYRTYGYAKVRGLLNQLDNEEEPVTEQLRRFFSYFLKLNINLISQRTFRFNNDNLNLDVKELDVTVICHQVGDATVWIKTHEKEIHEVDLKENDLLIIDNSISLFRRKPNFISRFVDKYSTFDNSYIQTLLYYVRDLSV